MPPETSTPPTTRAFVDLSPEDVEIVIAALRLLLDSEDDVDTIRRTKALLVRLAEAAR